MELPRAGPYAANTVRTPCTAALGRMCSADRRHEFDCAACGGRDLPQLRDAGCDSGQIAAWCGGAEPAAAPAVPTILMAYRTYRTKQLAFQVRKAKNWPRNWPNFSPL